MTACIEALPMVDLSLKPDIAIFGPVSEHAKTVLRDVKGCYYSSGERMEDLQGVSGSRLKAIVLTENVSMEHLERYLPSVREANPSLVILAISSEKDHKKSVLEIWVDRMFYLPAEDDSFLQELYSAASGSSRIARKIGQGLSGLFRFFLSLAILVVFWDALVRFFEFPPYLLPTPREVLSAFTEQYRTFASHLGTTAYEAFAGFLVGNTLGIVSAIVLHRFYRLQELTMPIFISLQAIPIVALAPMLIVWLGTGLTSKVAMAAIICFFPMVVNALQAFANIDRDFQELFRFHRASYLLTLRLLLIPASFSALLSALKISAGLSVVGAIVAELTGANMGLGYLLLNASYRLETDKMFVAMLLSALLGIVFFHLLSLLRFVVPRSWSLEVR